ncbi:hypothetical protein FB451DRAFT_1198706 [Mycena latifolia]|nr:hypothetical protein FB451DRAFT_1198706 [Mycena latifolia]
MAQRRIELRTFREAYRELHRNADFPPATRTECVTTTPLDHVCERCEGPVRGARKRNGKEGWLNGGLNSGLPAKDVLVQEPWQDALQLRHRVANTKRPERMEQGLRVIKKGRSWIGGELGPDMECPRLGPTSPGCGIGAGLKMVQLLAKEVGGAEPAGSRLQQANGYFGQLWFVVQEAPKSIFHLGLDELDPASPSEAPPRGSVEQIQSPLT